MTRTRHFMRLYDGYGAHHYSRLPVVIHSASGVWATDVEGKKYIDCLSAYSAISHGHCHPKIVAAHNKQSKRLMCISEAFYNDVTGPFLKKLAALCGKDRVLMMNSGAEAVETAIKISRKWGYSPAKGVDENTAEIIAFKNNFHGRTTTIISFSSEEQYRDGFGPLTGGFRIIEYGKFEALQAAITKNTVAVLVEPIQGEGGIVVPPAGYLQEIRNLCTAENVLMIADEIQTGFGRTGKLFCCDHEEVVPDIYVLGKALGGGIPVSAVAANSNIMLILKPGDHGSTFGGNPLSCATASAAIDVLVEERLAERAEAMGNEFRRLLYQINSPFIKDVRGKGLLIGVELTAEAGPAREVAIKMLAEGVLCKDTHGTIIRFAPPLIIKKREIRLICKAFEKVLSSLKK